MWGVVDKKEIIGIQYLRGIAAVSVVMGHTAVMIGFKKYFGLEPMGGFFESGARGVDLFFLISGFIICMISFRGRHLTPVMSVREFAERRFVRIVPLMWMAIVSYALLRLLGRGTFEWQAYARALALFPSGNVEPNTIWTLRHEAIFYCLFAVSFLSGRFRQLIIGAWFVAPIIYSLSNMPADPNSPVQSFLFILANPVNIEFATGFAIGVLWHMRTNGFSFSLPVSPLLVFAAAMIGYMFISHYLGLSFSNLYSTGISSVTCAVMLFAGVHVRTAPGLLDRVGRLFGDASYSIYLFHLHFVSAVLGVWSKVAYSTPILVVLVGTLCIVFGSCLLIHLFVEKPLVRQSRKAFQHFRVPRRVRL